METFHDMLAIVTNASSPLAKPLVSALLSQGATVALVDKDPGTLHPIAEEFAHSKIYTYAVHSDEGSVSRAVQQITSEHQIPSMLITCSKSGDIKPSLETSSSQIRDFLEEHLIHSFVWSKIVGQIMIEAQAGVIVHVTELSGLGGWPGWLSQSITFGGLHNLVHTLAVEWAQTKVRVNGLVPGITPRMADQIAGSSGQDSVRKRIPQERLMNDDDLGKALLYLLSPTSSYITGEILKVDGGWDIWGQLYAVAKE